MMDVVTPPTIAALSLSFSGQLQAAVNTDYSTVSTQYLLWLWGHEGLQMDHEQEDRIIFRNKQGK